MESDYLLAGGRLVLPDAVLEGGSLLVEKGRIARILAAGEPLPERPRRIDATGAWVTPGLMELHIHGAGGMGFDALDAEPGAAAARLEGMRSFLAARGVTAFLPTLVAEEGAVARLAAAIAALGLPRRELPGLYVEGPFVNPARRGGIPLEFLRAPDTAVLERFIGAARGFLRIMTYAPELPGAAAVAGLLAAAGVVPALGHSDAILGRFEPPAGTYSITHLFNAMSPFSHKDAGLAMLPFTDGRPYVELISDGVHVNDEALRAASAAVAAGRLILISDAASAAGLPDGEYEYFGRRVASGARGVRYVDTDVLMGSRRLGPELLRHWLGAAGRPVNEGVLALTRTPRRLLGIGDRGAIEIGQGAELVVWDGEFESPRLVLGAR